MEEEKEAFYVVRKGDIVAIYRSLSDCQAQVGSSVLNPSVSVFKGYCLPKETEGYLASHGIKNAIYSISAANVTDDLFGQLLPCPFQQPRPSIGITADTGSPSTRLQDKLETEDFNFAASDSLPTNFLKQFNSKTDFKVVVPTSQSTNFQKQLNSNEGFVARATSSVCNFAASDSLPTNFPKQVNSKIDFKVAVPTSQSTNFQKQLNSNEGFVARATSSDFAASDSLPTNFPKQVNSKIDFKVAVPTSQSTNFQKQLNSNEGFVARATSPVCDFAVSDSLPTNFPEQFNSNTDFKVAVPTSQPTNFQKQLNSNDFVAVDSLPTNFSKQFNSNTDFKVAVPNSQSINFQKQLNSNEGFVARATSSVCLSCVLEFDGASKGNPGPAGAGALLRPDDDRWVCKLQEGVGIATNNVAEYRALILGLRHALEEGYKHIRVVGDSKLVCSQIQGVWKIKNQNMANLCKVATELKDKFVSFQINHIPRELNCRADDLANHAVNLRDGEVVANCKIK